VNFQGRSNVACSVHCLSVVEVSLTNISVPLVCLFLIQNNMRLVALLLDLLYNNNAWYTVLAKQVKCGVVNSINITNNN